MHKKKEQADFSVAPPYHTITLKYVLMGTGLVNGVPPTV